MPKRVSLKGKGAELFFGDYPTVADTDTDPAPATAPPDGDPGAPAMPPGAADSNARSTVAPEAAPAAPPMQAKASRRAARSHSNASKPRDELASTLASVDASTVAAIRQVVKVPGREVSYLRLTPEEKADLADIVYTYKRQGQKTSETEINRIALNYLLLDYRENGQQSVLARVLAALLA
jgi:hypothetical protein